MTVSMRVMSAGTGYRYLLDSVAVGDGRREAGRPLTDYYTMEGCPPGRWLGSGLAGLDGEVRAGSEVGEEQLARLLGEGRDPTSGAALGRAYPRFRPAVKRAAARVALLDPALDGASRAAAVERISAEERERGTRRAVAGFDLTFSVPKSVSVLWALGDPDTRQVVAAAHHAAIDDVIGLIEREVAMTRLGASGPEGPVAQVEVRGVIAAAFDHFDSRAGDPQLHTHVVIANKVQAADGRWRALDGRPVHAGVVALSEHYNAVLADHLTSRLGVVWNQRDRGADRNAGWEIVGIPDALMRTFSSRASAIDTVKDQLVADYVAAHGRQPTSKTVIRLRQQATLQSRPHKRLRSLADLTASWRATARQVLGEESTDVVRRLLAHARVQQRLRAGEVSDATVHGVAQQVVHVVGERRATWRRWNLHAEASRQLMGVRFATTADRETTLTRVVDAAEAASVQLTPPDLAVVPAELRRADGSSVLRPRHATVFTSAELLAAEDELLELGRRSTGPRLPAGTIARHAGGLGADQAAAVARVATSGRMVDVLIGPAGAGKTTAMRTLRQAWEDLYGPRSVIGLAPSAAAAEVLAADLDIETETCAKWIHDNASARAGQLVIIDEASLAGTHALDRITRTAAAAGAKVLLVGDPAQLAAVDAGGALALLAKDRDDTAELTDVRRFHHPWEAAATLRLRNGNDAVLDAYGQHDRLHDGDSEQMLDAAYTAWRTDIAAGRTSLLIAPTRDQVTALNQRARADRIATGEVDPAIAVRLHDGTLAGPGDTIVTRRNDRRASSASGRWVRNGDRWTVHAIHPDGSITATGRAGGRVWLTAHYTAAHVELGYATTAHRAQGATVDTAHTLVTPAMTRETLYVAMTRGRHANNAYSCIDQVSETEPHQDHDDLTGRTVLADVLARTGAEPSAHQAIATEQNRHGSITQLAAEYDTIAAAAQHRRWTQLIHTSGLTEDQAETVIASDAFGPLCAALRRAEAHGLHPEQLLPNVIAARLLGDAGDLAAVLHHRLTAAVEHQQQTPPVAHPELIVGLIPAATGPMTPDTHTALQQRRQLIQQRAVDVLRTALESDEPWIHHLGSPPTDSPRRRAWVRHAATVAAYRDRYTITTSTPIGPLTGSDVRRADAAAAAEAIRQARAIAQAARLASPDYSRRPVARAWNGPSM